MAMGVASMAVTAPKHSALAVTPRASASNTGEKQGFLDWFRTALDKDSLSETDAVLAKVNGSAKSNGKADAGKKGSPVPPPKKAGFNFFGKK